METTLQSTKNIKEVIKFFEENTDMIRSTISSQVNDKTIIDDIFHNLFLSFVDRPVPPNIENVKAYLKRAIRNDIIDYEVKRKCCRVREQKYVELRMVNIKYDNPEDTVTANDAIQNLFNIVEHKLPAHEAEAIIQKYRYDRNIDEAAMIMGINERSFSRYLCTGLKKLRQYINENGL